MGDTDVNQVFTLAAGWRERLRSQIDRSTALVELVGRAILTDEGIRLGSTCPSRVAGQAAPRSERYSICSDSFR